VAIVALLISWFPFIGAVAAVIALVLGVIAWVAAKKSGRPAGLAIAATIVSIIALLIAIVVTVAFIALIDKAQEEEDYCNSVSSTQQEFDDCMADRVGSWFGIEPSS
jgi:cytochrome bd-type quinol oxidase subunit 2